MIDFDFDALTHEQLQARHSVKWTQHPPDVLPMFVAESDVVLAPSVTYALRAMVEAGDTGYANPVGLAQAFTGFAQRRHGWTVDPAHCVACADVMSGVAEVLTALTPPGSAVVVCPPVYFPFYEVPRHAGRTVVRVPLVDGALDLAGIDAALAAGARSVLISSPHNPTGRVWTADELDGLAQVADRHDAVVLADEIHSPLVLPGATFAPYLGRGERHAVALVSASKAFNLAGLKASLVVAGSQRVADQLAVLPESLPFHCGLPGVLAAQAAWTDGDQWLDGLLAHLDRNRTLLAQLLERDLPWVRMAWPQAGYLVWLDFSAHPEVAAGADPAALLLERGRLALSDGPQFGPQGVGHARINIATTRDLLVEGVRRMTAAFA